MRDYRVKINGNGIKLKKDDAIAVQTKCYNPSQNTEIASQSSSS